MCEKYQVSLDTFWDRSMDMVLRSLQCLSGKGILCAMLH